MNKYVFSYFLTTCLLYFVNAQLINHESVDHWESIFYASDDFRYITNDSLEPLSSWRSDPYDDSSWSVGVGGFGYGDNDDETELPGISSVFLRRNFEIVDKNEVEEIVFHVDYDDAFVAYINGKEIARSAGLSDTLPLLNTLSSTQHEAKIPSGGLPEYFALDPTNFLKDGSNIFSLQVHNASTSSSDLTAAAWLSVGLNIGAKRYKTTPDWFILPGQLPELVSNLPIMVLETQGQSILNEPKITARMGLIYNGPGINNSTLDAFNEYDGYVGIETRGNSTQGFPKKPYLFETRDSLGQNLNVNLLGLPKENDWILRASYIDHTFIRNSLANYLSRETGQWASGVKHVEVILNGEYQGIYLLMEKVKRDKNRVNIAKLDSFEIQGEDLTGGYIWEVSGFGNDLGFNRSLKYPKIDEAHPKQVEYIKNVDDSFRELMSGESIVYSDPNTGYSNHINTASFIYEMLVQEIMRNSDAYGWSAYFHKDKNGLITAGPVWDFDQSLGNSSYPDNGVIGMWMASHPNTSNTPFFWPLLLEDLFFKYSLKLRWQELRNNSFSDENLIHFVDSIASELFVAQQREFEKWPVLGATIYRETTGYQERDTYQKEVDYLKSFLLQRCNWMDDELSVIAVPPAYPQITAIPQDTLMININDIQLGIDISGFFDYPYPWQLKYSVEKKYSDFATFQVLDSSNLRIHVFNHGVDSLSIICEDSYGNKMINTIIIKINPNPLNHDENTEENIFIFPNPAQTEINFQWSRSLPKALYIKIYDISGHLIDHLEVPEGRSRVFYRRGSLESGLYVMELALINGEYIRSKFLIN